MTTWRPFEEVLQEALQDPETRAEWDRTQLAREVSIWLISYRTKHGLTQTELARQLGWKQPMVARLETGEREPSFGTLHHLVERLGNSARIEINPEGISVRFVKRRSPRRTKARGRGARRNHITQKKAGPSRVLQPV